MCIISKLAILTLELYMFMFLESNNHLISSFLLININDFWFKNNGILDISEICINTELQW